MDLRLRTAKMKSLFFICLLLVLYGTAESWIRKYFYIHHLKTWIAAQNYCKQNNGDLAIITTEEEYRAVVECIGYTLLWVWIGLNRTTPHGNTWQWPNGKKADFTKWFNAEPDDRKSPGENCVVMDPNGWYDDLCDEKYNFVCSKSFILVTESKTWEEALQHCRTHYSYLVTVDSQTLQDLLKTETTQAQTVSVWTGLRFLDGKWFWKNGVPMGSLISLPQCPIRPYHCGAFNLNSYIWENRDCNEKLNFFCYH